MTTDPAGDFARAKVLAHNRDYDLRKFDNPDPLNPNERRQFALRRRLDGRGTRFENLDKVFEYLETKRPVR
jgi:hypothetical protein